LVLQIAMPVEVRPHAARGILQAGRMFSAAE